MSAQEFIAELERRGYLPARLMEKLRETITAADKPQSAKTLAKFLVQKQHLSQKQATEILGALVMRGIDPEATPGPEAVGNDLAGEVSFGPAAANEPQLKLNPVEQLAASDMVDENDEGSSIFAPYLTGKGTSQDTAPRARDEAEDELTLAPDEELDSRDAPEPQFDYRPVPPVRSAAASTPSKNAAGRRATEADANSSVMAEIDRVTAPRVPGLKNRKLSKKKSKPTKRKNQWDSPLMLLGGGGLALLLLCGATIWWLLNWESGDQQLKLARAAMDSGAYGQAIEQYEKFLAGSPRHPERSLARVQLAMLRVRQATEADDYAAALELAEKELGAIEDEEDFDEAHDELAALLPQIATGLAEKADQAGPGTEEADRLTELTNKAVALCSNEIYLPKPLRDETKLAIVRETLQRIERRQETHRALDEGLKTMRAAIEKGDTSAAYIAHRRLLREHPELSSDASLGEILKTTTSAEQAAIRFIKEERAVETNERPTPWRASLAVANRRVKAPAAAEGVGKATACLRVDGALYGLDVASGRLLWRRHVGYAADAWPILIESDVLVADDVHHELLRLDAATGRLKWRQAIGEPFSPPLVVANRGFIAAESGRLYVIDVPSGARRGYLQFAQPLRAAPAADRGGKRIYLTGDHSSLYTISLDDLTCLGVNYLGHAEGSIGVSPVAVMNKLAILENDGVETSRLRLMSLDDAGRFDGQEVERRLNGLATSPPHVAGRRMMVVTDRGQIEVYEVATADGEDALTVVATRAAAGPQSVIRHAAHTGRNFWVGDTRLTKYSILPTGNRLPVEEIENDFAGATFDHPLALFGETIVHVRRPKGRAGVTIAATDTAQGRTLWETDVAMPPAGPPVVDDAAKALTVANADGIVFRFDEAAIRSRVQDEPLAVQSKSAKLPALTEAIALGQGRAVFCAPDADQALLYNPALGQRSARWIKLESPLACAVTSMGDGFIAPLTIGQVFYLSAADGSSLATPFQPLLQPRTAWDYAPAGVVDEDSRRFVIADGREKIYLVAVVDRPQPHLETVAEADIDPYPIESAVVVMGDTAMAVAGGSHLVRFRLPTLERAGESNLPAPVVWGPFRVGDALLVATADEKLLAVSAAGEVTWQAPIEHGDLAGAPLALKDSVLLAYRKGVVERRAIADGKSLSTTDLQQPLAAGPIGFLGRFVLSANDGTLLVIDQP